MHFWNAHDVTSHFDYSNTKSTQRIQNLHPIFQKIREMTLGKTLFHQRYIYIYNLSGLIRFDTMQQNVEADLKRRFLNSSFYVYTQLFMAHRLVMSDFTERFGFRTYEVSDF